MTNLKENTVLTDNFISYKFPVGAEIPRPLEQCQKCKELEQLWLDEQANSLSAENDLELANQQLANYSMLQSVDNDAINYLRTRVATLEADNSKLLETSINQHNKIEILQHSLDCLEAECNYQSNLIIQCEDALKDFDYDKRITAIKAISMYKRGCLDS